MSNLEQLKDNLATFETEDSLTKEEWDGLLALGGEMTNPKALACAACRYCTSHCPQGLDIPHLLALYNEHRFTGRGFIAPMALSAIPQDRQPGACIGCRGCDRGIPSSQAEEHTKGQRGISTAVYGIVKRSGVFLPNERMNQDLCFLPWQFAQ